MIPRHSAAEGAGKSDVQQVEVTRLDDFCRAEGITKVDFIKIDIDGPDFEALQGAEGILKSPNKPLLSIEMSHYWEEFGHNFSQAFAYLKDLGYVVYIAQRKSSEFFRLDNPEGLPEGLGTLPRQTFNFFGASPGDTPEPNRPDDPFKPGVVFYTVSFRCSY